MHEEALPTAVRGDTSVTSTRRWKLSTDGPKGAAGRAGLEDGLCSPALSPPRDLHLPRVATRPLLEVLSKPGRHTLGALGLK